MQSLPWQQSIQGQPSETLFQKVEGQLGIQVSGRRLAWQRPGFQKPEVDLRDKSKSLK